MRGGYNQRGRGGVFDANNFGGNPMGSPSDTLNISITDIQQPVTEEVMRRVFDKVGAMTRHIALYPSNSPNETNVLAQFVDAYAAERVMSGLNNRNIFNNANKMTMSYAAPPPAVMPLGGGCRNSNAVLSSPADAFGASAGAMTPAPMGMFNQAPNAAYTQPAPMMPLSGGANGNMMGSVMGLPTMMNQPPPPLPRGDYSPMTNLNNSYLPYNNNNNMGFVNRRGMARGGRGLRGRGNFNNPAAAVFNPMARPPMGMPFMNIVPGMMPFPAPMMGAGMPSMPTMAGQTVFLSVTVVPVTEPLQSIFVLIEAYGGVVSMRRNQKQKEILTVKMASTSDADAVARYLHRVPFAGITVSAKKFHTYVERNPCTDDGDPQDAETTQYDFTAARHRSPGQRSKSTPTNIVKITGCSGYSETDLMTYFNSQNFFPENISKGTEGAFLLKVTDAETAVKLLISCQGNVCGEERSNVIFMEAPKELPVEKVSEE